MPLHTTPASLRQVYNCLLAEVWDDEYLLGFAQSTIAFLNRFHGRVLSTEQKGLVMIETVRRLAGERYQQVCERMMLLMQSPTDKFSRGAEHGANVNALIGGLPTELVLSKPEVREAIAEAPEAMSMSAELFGASNQSEYAAAGGLLMQRYMSKHSKYYRIADY